MHACITRMHKYRPRAFNNSSDRITYTHMHYIHCTLTLMHALHTNMQTYLQTSTDVCMRYMPARHSLHSRTHTCMTQTLHDMPQTLPDTNSSTHAACVTCLHGIHWTHAHMHAHTRHKRCMTHIHANVHHVHSSITCTCTHTHTHAHTHTHTHTYRHMRTYMNKSQHIPLHIVNTLHIYLYACTWHTLGTCAHTSMNACVHRIYIFMHPTTNMHAYIHSCICYIFALHTLHVCMHALHAYVHGTHTQNKTDWQSKRTCTHACNTCMAQLHTCMHT